MQNKDTHRVTKQTYDAQRGNQGRRDELGGWDQHTYSHIHETDNLERPIIKLSSHVYKNIDQLIPQRVSGNLGIVTLTCCVFQETTV